MGDRLILLAGAFCFNGSMSKGKTNIIGLIEDFRPNDHHDGYRVAVCKDGKQQAWIGPKVDPRVRQINDHLKRNRLREEQALEDKEFLRLRSTLHSVLKDEHGLREYRIRERIFHESKEFDFHASLDDFVEYKSDTSIPVRHRYYMEQIWLPFYSELGCQHPREWKQYRGRARQHIKTVKKKERDERYSPETRVGIAATLNQYMNWCLSDGHITENEHFNLSAGLTLEQKKQSQSTQQRSKEVYSVDDLIDMKKKIDATYANNLLMKVRAYGIYFGVGSGLRRGNLLGMESQDLQPDSELIPHFCTRHNIVDGSGRGKKGPQVLLYSSKTTVGIVKLPMIQPSVGVLQEVARFLKAHLRPDEPIVKCHPSTVARWWKKICQECGFKYISPHGWKHSYATNGAEHFVEWYGGDAYLLQKCCMHESFQTTQKYINQKGDSLLKAFAKKQSPQSGRS